MQMKGYIPKAGLQPQHVAATAASITSPATADNMTLTLHRNRQTHHRQLGAVRRLPQMDSVPKFPPLRPNLDKNYAGIMGNALHVPPPRELPAADFREERTSGSVSHTREIKTSMSMDSACVEKARRSGTEKAKELREALSREKLLKQQIGQLQKAIEELRTQIEEKDDVIAQLQEQIQSQSDRYKELYEKECEGHKHTQNALHDVRQEVAAKDTQLQAMESKHRIELDALRQQMETRIEDLCAEKDKEIALRDGKLTKLKNQMAEALKGNSWERQQQLDELTKELGRVQEEADHMRIKMKGLQKGKRGCSSCQDNRDRVASAHRAMESKDGSIRELQERCSKLEQLVQQRERVLKK